jgi:hypothetical protein
MYVAQLKRFREEIHNENDATTEELKKKKLLLLSIFARAKWL